MKRRRWRGLGAIIGITMVAFGLGRDVQATSLLPNGQQQFLNANGTPLAGGFVYMYQPNTTLCKATWKDSLQTNANTCPITLDSSGSALIYGIGCYTQIVQDALANQVYNQLTCEPGVSNLIVWGGSATGTANAIQLPTATGFTAADGQVINFVPIATNTGATTIAAGTQPAIPVVKDTTGGPVALSGGEIVFSGSGNVVSVAYSATQNNLHLLTTAIPSASGASTPLCSATGLRITNSGGAPNTIISLTADQIYMTAVTGQSIQRSNVNVTINITLGNVTSTAGGMDGEVPSGAINIWAIDNGTGVNGLANLQTGSVPGASVVQPTLPTGYIYKCRLGATLVNGGNLIRFLSVGNRTRYVASGANPYPVNSLGAYWSLQGLSGVIPPTATAVTVSLQCIVTAPVGGNVGHCAIAPNNGYGTAPNGANPVPPIGSFLNNNLGVATGSVATVVNSMGDIVLESNVIYTGQTSAAGQINFLGWIDKVSAN